MENLCDQKDIFQKTIFNGYGIYKMYFFTFSNRTKRLKAIRVFNPPENL